MFCSNPAPNCTLLSASMPLVVSGKIQSIFIATKLVNCYANLGDVSFSRYAFDHISNKNVYTWNSMVSAYVCSGRCCFEWDVFMAASLLHMYCRFGLAGVARKLFNDMPIRDRGYWNAMISGYCQSGNAAKALAVLHEIRLEGVNMDPVTIASILPVCAQLDDTVSGMLIHLHISSLTRCSDLEFSLESLASIVAQLNDHQGCRSVHGFIMRRGWLMEDVIIGNAVVDMYAKLGVLGSARTVFEGLPIKDSISCNTLITGALRQLMKIHGRVIKDRLYLDVFVGTCLIDMYGT
ncbi:hypothetical protein EZV62_001889 [Acer yangbiense]|uniref:Pentatricopeptide repeat-containing protein n=1 Tax=Acer yangbiense TaxID=1000413 RepID=A0A5C7IVJ0_9ROSI|nr:hypothetical protein EZV62_001889 [Acer yangbiense]